MVQVILVFSSIKWDWLIMPILIDKWLTRFEKPMWDIGTSRISGIIHVTKSSALRSHGGGDPKWWWAQTLCLLLSVRGSIYAPGQENSGYHHELDHSPGNSAGWQSPPGPNPVYPRRLWPLPEATWEWPGSTIGQCMGFLTRERWEKVRRR